VTRGFSGVGAGFVGFVFVALLAGLRRAFGSRTAVFTGLAIWLLLVFEVYVIYAGAVGLSVAGLLALGWGCCLWGLLGEIDLAAVEISEQWPALGQVVTVVILLVLFVAVLFPTRIVTNGAVTNVFAHAAGLLAGMAGAWLIHRALYPVEETATSEK
jgi:hypothetical protein